MPIRADHHLLPRDVAAHDHDFFEVAVVTQGHGAHLTASGDHDLRAGSVVLIPPHQWHGYADCRDLFVFDCFIGPELIDGILAFLPSELALIGALANRSLPAPQRLELTPDQLAIVTAELDWLSDPRRPSRMSSIGHLLICLDVLDQAWMPSKTSYGRSSDRLHPAVARAAETLEKSRERAWTLAELAVVAAVERTHLVRLFRRDLGISPIAYLNQLREQEAARLLVQTDDPIARIGTRVGWDDAAYFARRFKAAYGLSPSAYRKRALAGEAGH